MPPIIRIAAVQFQTTPDIRANLVKVEGFFKQATGYDLICFPESFLTGSEDLKVFRPKMPKESKELFSQLCKKYRINAIMGSIHEKEGGKLKNVSYVFNRKGTILGLYSKQHLVPRCEEETDYVKGSSIPVFDLDIGRIGVLICRDLWYPEIMQEFVRKKADVFFCPAFWSQDSDYYLKKLALKYPFNTELRVISHLVPARSFESCTPLVFVNGAGNFRDEEGYDKLLGRTQVALPFYGTFRSLKHRREGILLCDIDLQVGKDAKEAYALVPD